MRNEDWLTGQIYELFNPLNKETFIAVGGVISYVTQIRVRVLYIPIFMFQIRIFKNKNKNKNSEPHRLYAFIYREAAALISYTYVNLITIAVKSK